MCLNLPGISKQLQTSGIVLDLVDRAIKLRDLAVGREYVMPHKVANTALTKLELHAWVRRSAYREHETNEDHAKVEALLRRASRLFSRGELVPWYKAIVVERSYCSAFRTWRSGSSQAVMGGVMPWEEGTSESWIGIEDGGGTERN